MAFQILAPSRAVRLRRRAGLLWTAALVLTPLAVGLVLVFGR